MSMVVFILLWLTFSKCIFSSQNVFSVNDDVFAYPQYEIDFSPSYVLVNDAAALLQASKGGREKGMHRSDDDPAAVDDVEFEQMILHGRRYLCSIPRVKSVTNTTEETPSKEDEQRELTRAADRGWQLLQDMEGKQCLYYSTGWWSYAFCYNAYVKQFHSLPPAPGGARTWPPVEDQTTPSYILGKYEPKAPKEDEGSLGGKLVQTGLQTRADGNYLIQKLDGGTPCDLTGKNRKVEVEYHCHPQTTDRIGWIKETSTCTYLMVVYTPRLCNDVAFQPPRDSQAHILSCQEILTISDATNLHEGNQEPATIGPSQEMPITIGKIELGAMNYVGKDGKKLERGRIVMTAEEKAEIIIMQADGQIQALSRAKMKELNLKPEDIEDFKNELQKIAGSKDWKIERLVDGNGQIELRGIISADGDGDEYHFEANREDDEGEGSKEEYKPEL